MRINKLLCLALLALSTNLEAQDLKILVNKKGLIGYADRNGKEVIKCQYESAMPFREGTAIVTKSGQTGIIDTTGKVLLPLNYTQITPWNSELYLIAIGKKVGLANHQGKVVLPAEYSHISKPNCYGKALLALGGKLTTNDKKKYMAYAKYGIIDIKGNVLVKPTYRGLYEFSFDGKEKYPYYEGKRLEHSYHYTVDTLKTDCAYLGFSNNGFDVYNAGVMDGNGKELLKTGLYYYVMQPQNNMVRYYIVKKQQTLCGYHNLSTGKSFQAATFEKPVNEIDYWSHGDFIGDIAPVNGKSWSFIDKTGKVLRTGFAALRHSQVAGLWAVKTNSGTWDVFNDANSDIASLSGYDDIKFPANKTDREIFTVQKNGKYGCVSRTGDVVVPFEYEEALANTFGVVAVQKEGRWGLVSESNAMLIPTEFVNIILPQERDAKHYWVMKSDSLYYHMHLQTNKLASKGYKAVTNFSNGIALVRPHDMVLDDTPSMRAQVYAPNAPKATLDSLDLAKYKDSFGYLINQDDILLTDFPVSMMYKDILIKEMEKCGRRTLSKAETKSILLKATCENRSYDLKATLKEDEWNY